MNAREAIRAVVEDWALWRDSGDFDRLEACWHPDGRMMTTWGQFDVASFVTAARAAWDRGVDVAHTLSGMSADIVGDRAVVQTRMTIHQRGLLDGVTVDVACTGRFYDLFERRGGCWAIVLRQPIYERDRIDPVTPGAAITLDPNQLAKFPVGYRHLAYLQTSAGMTVADDLPGLRGAAVQALYARGADWLAMR